MSFSASSAELQWRAGRTTATSSTRPTVAKRFVQPGQAGTRVDRSVQPAAFEDEGPQLSSGGEGSVQFRSIIVSRENEPEGVRSAQLPGTPPGASELPQSPFTPDDLPPLAPQDEAPLDFDALPPPRNENLEFEPTQREPQRTEPARPPVDFRPRSLPAEGAETPSVPPPLPADKLEDERTRAQEACEEGLEDLQEQTIDRLNLTIAVSGVEGSDFPFECSLDRSGWHEGRCWEQTVYLWKASALCHKPLYFEEEQLERYGHSWPPCFQPVVSGAHFFATLPVLPYCMGVEPPMECVYALGHYRPGSCAPYMCNPIPISARGALIQAGVVTGAAVALP